MENPEFMTEYIIHTNMKKYMTWNKYHMTVRKLADKLKDEEFDNIYGIPRGGLVVAVSLSHLLEKPITLEVGERTLVVDDICDFGRTLKPYENNLTATLYYRKNKTIEPNHWILDARDKFIQFPWETEKSAKINYVGK